MKKNIKLHNILFPSVEMSEHWGMFYHGTMLISNHISNSFVFSKKYDFCDFATYFNSFSYRKWKTYTNIEDLNLQLVLNGKFNITLTAYQEKFGKIKKYFLDEQTVIAEKDKPLNIKYPVLSEDYTIVAFELKTLSKNCEIYSGYYYTNVDESLIRDVSLSLVTTTFKKEQFIIPNIEMLKKEIINSDEAIAKGFDIHVIDNGRTLNPESYNCEHLTVHPNKNVGGAGGFARGMIETIRQKNPATHVLLMDDDVIIMPEALKRTYNLLSLIKDEYKDHFISGAMLKMEQMNEQEEDIGMIYYTPGENYGPLKKRTYFLHLLDEVVLNEEFRKKSDYMYAGWWYCCIPIKFINENNLPLPLFIRGDDVEFSLRNNAEFISMNGICIWHMGFANKYVCSLELYQVFRNSFIFQAISDVCPKIDFLRKLCVNFYSEIYRFNYNGASLLLDAIEDFMKGADFFSSLDGEKVMKEKGTLDDKLDDIENFKNIFVNLGRVYADSPMTKKERFIYQLTDNGHRFCPSFLLRKEYGVIPFNWCHTPSKQFLRKRLLVVDPLNKKCIERKIDKRKYKQLKKRYKRLMKQYGENINKISAEYRSKQKLLTSISFWENYLGE